MTTPAALFVFFAGLLLTFGAVGGIETSVNDEQMLASMLLAILGLLAMYAGTLGLRNSNYYDRG
jgi:hypothetical protein